MATTNSTGNITFRYITSTPQWFPERRSVQYRDAPGRGYDTMSTLSQAELQALKRRMYEQYNDLSINDWEDYANSFRKPPKQLKDFF